MYCRHKLWLRFISFCICNTEEVSFHDDDIVTEVAWIHAINTYNLFSGGQISFFFKEHHPSQQGLWGAHDWALAKHYFLILYTIDGFHSIFSLGNWRALHHHAAYWLVNIHIRWHFCPPVSMVKDAMESVYSYQYTIPLQWKLRWRPVDDNEVLVAMP